MNPGGRGGCGGALAKTLREERVRKSPRARASPARKKKRGGGGGGRSGWKLIQWKSLALSVDNSNFITGARDYDLLETSSQSVEAGLVKRGRNGRENSQISGSELQTAPKGLGRG